MNTRNKKIALTLAATIIAGGALSFTNFNSSDAAELNSTKEIHILPMKISEQLNNKLKNVKLSYQIPSIVIFNKHLSDKEYKDLEKKIGKFHIKNTYSKVLEGFSANLTKRQIELLNNVSFVSLIDLDSKISLGKEITITSDFVKNSDQWSAGFADYPKKDRSIYKLNYSFNSLPKEINMNQKGLYLSGVNRSDDLFMFVKKKIDKTSKLKPNQTYLVTFDFDIATNAAKDSMGAGGSPGESVYVKAGVTKKEPKSILNKDYFYQMNIDKGQQSQEGKDAFVLGNLSKSTSTDQTYEVKTFNNKNRPFLVKTDAKGELWIILGTDSAFESETSIYITRTKITLKEI
ncbi:MULTISPECIES: hypothetical protein [unclassified Paenibacillus]|uniref:hypothetical protein n=1 Tax=unclassified Paenibacillus TaxID=185978 RepID=UPI0009A69A6F|nr:MULTISPECIES: hypothetical protein [unclassified Paenibacillus]SLJ88524.1 hypothetical protein SAMN06272722_101171 [Paenibacillus sp. RU5A]SOC63184.1 hypothetical protein SAMN05880581_1011020 [Paenibacillus sp. RU26A]SOC68522.1 hypothetical protein SAMN05880586_1011019 [Paenibacillus sp. RU5M]